jgi:hypothetical protein
MTDGVKTRVARALITAASICACMTTSARASQHGASRPKDWPEARRISSCEELSGAYVNFAIARTPWLTHRYEGPAPLLSEVFYESNLKLDSHQVIRMEVHPDLSISMDGESMGNVDAVLEGKSKSRCEGNSLVWEYEGRAYSEHSREKQHQTLEFTTASDGSLVVHRIFAAKGYGFLMVPFSEISEDWLRFQRAPE